MTKLIRAEDAHDNDLIRRGAAIGALEERRDQYLPDSPTWLQIELDIRALTALPAVSPGVRVRALEWVDFNGKGAKAQAWNDANYMIQKWSDGRWEISASYPGYSTFIEGTDRFYPTLDAAKAAAQADYEARILAALAPAEAGGVEGRPDAPCHIVEYTNWRGETARRAIIPIRMWWGKTEWHPQEQWMLTAWDVEKEATRDFAWQDMKPVQNGATSAAVAAQRAAPAPVDALVKAAEEAVEVIHKAYVSATMEAVNAGPSHPLKDNFDKWRVRCLRAEEVLRATLAAYRGDAK